MFCNGMVRSASTWSYNVAVHLLKSTGREVFGGYDEDIARFLASAPPETPYLVLKSHSLEQAGRTLVDDGKAKAIFTCRDLADSAVSFMRMFEADFEHAYSTLTGSLELYRYYRRSGGSLILGYREITTQPRAAIGRIASYLEVAANAEALEKIAEETSLSRLRQTALELEGDSRRGSLIGSNQLRYDPATLLHPNHIRDGGSGYGSKALTAEERRRLDALAEQYDFSPDFRTDDK